MLAVSHRGLRIHDPAQPPGTRQRVNGPVVIVKSHGELAMLAEELPDALVQRSAQHEGAALAGPLEQEVRARWRAGGLQEPLPPVLPGGKRRARIAGGAL